MPLYTSPPIWKTFTPTIALATMGDLSPTYNAQSGYYMQMGKMVFFNLVVDFDTNAYTTATGAATIEGLPIAASATGETFQNTVTVGPMTNVTLGSASRAIRAAISPSSTSISLATFTNGGGPAGFFAGQWPASTTGIVMPISGFYRID